MAQTEPGSFLAGWWCAPFHPCMGVSVAEHDRPEAPPAPEPQVQLSAAPLWVRTPVPPTPTESGPTPSSSLPIRELFPNSPAGKALPAPESAPVTLVPVAQWVPDESVAQCPTCSARFSLFNRKHHCRACGGVFCHACSSQQLPLTVAHQAAPGVPGSSSPGSPAKPGLSSLQRVCDGCFARLAKRLSVRKLAAAASVTLPVSPTSQQGKPPSR